MIVRSVVRSERSESDYVVRSVLIVRGVRSESERIGGFNLNL